jgi:hypothetical protein
VEALRLPFSFKNASHSRLNWGSDVGAWSLWADILLFAAPVVLVEAGASNLDPNKKKTHKHTEVVQRNMHNYCT